ncbi:hypothetical protein EB796_016724 [Bugula neritina]|uniref:EF-hand domain-containing protein n=1 Tax=Bugula neritina TaxID=10212 RepID=A0A7J7JH60_BUGNE|nr:hypothetical protein EB796_016724 [Bugula neritina]
MYRHSKTSLDGLQTRKTLKKTKDVKSVFDNQVRTGPLTGRMESVPHSAALSRRSTESNFMNLPGDGDCLPDLPRTPAMESEGDFLRSTSREQHSSMQRVESEMDIIIPPENENTSTAKSAKVRTPIKAPTPNPLKTCDLSAADLTLYHIKEEEMKAMFQKLDTDDDGHLMYQQVEPQFPQSLQPNQKKYLKQIYDITSASTYFGVKEFVTIKCLCDEVSKLDHQLMLRGFEKLDFPNLTTSVIQYTELFQQVDRASKGKITLDSLRDIICTALQKDKDHLEYGLSQLSDVLNLGDNDSVNKVKFIAGIPYYLTVASLEKPETGNEETPLK